jgi:transcriptional regulator with XRE-family HTH domain
MTRLREQARQAKADGGLSIADLVMASGLSRTAIMDMLNGRGRVSNGRIDSWWALAWALGVPFRDLMGALDENLCLERHDCVLQRDLPPPQES